MENKIKHRREKTSQEAQHSNKNLLVMVLLGLILIILPVILSITFEDAEKIESYETGGDVNAPGQLNSPVCQTFKIGTTGDNRTFRLIGASLNVICSGCSGEVYLKQTNSSLAPTGDIASNLTPPFPANGWSNFSFNATPILDKGNSYAVCFKHTGGGELSALADSTGAYTGGSAYEFNGSLAHLISGGNYDLIFSVWGSTLEPNVTLNKPSNLSTTLKDVILNCSADSDIALLNLTLYLDGIKNVTITNSTPNKMNLSLKTETIVSLGEHNYSCTSVNNEFTLGNSSIYFFNASILSEENQTYNLNTTEGNLETFNITITYNNTNYSNSLANFYYNGTSYSTTKYSNGDIVTFSRALSIPLVSVTKNATFYWDIVLINETSNHFNSTMHNQTVNNIQVGNCSSYSNVIINYTLRDEETQSIIDGSVANGTIEIDLQIYPQDSNEILMAYSTNRSQSNNLSVCLSTPLNNTQYRLYAQTKYSADPYVTEYHYFQNFIISNDTVPQLINLYDLLSVDSTDFRITYKDSNFLAVEDALVILNRKYVSEGIFKNVEIGKTDSSGQVVEHFDTTQIYSITVTKEGQTLSTFDNIAVFCEDKITGNCNINLYEQVSGTSPDNFYNYQNLNYILNFNQSTKLLSVTFNTIDGSSADISLNATKAEGYGNVSLCSSSISSSAGTISCTIPNTYGNITFYASLYKDGELVVTDIYTISPKATDVFGDNTFILVLMYVISIAVMFIPSAIGILIGLLIGVGITITLLYTSRAMIGATGFFIWLAVGIGIIIWKINRERGD